MEMVALRLGECCVPHEMTAPGVNDGTRLHIPISAFLLKLDNGQIGLVDTGMNVGHITDPHLTWRGLPQEKNITPAMRPGDDIGSWLTKAGVAASDVNFVINTHLHFDHAGNNALFPNATFYVQREHYEFAMGNFRFPNQYWNLPHLRYVQLDGDTEIAPNVAAMVTPGHAPGHQSVVVDLPESGRIIVCGDAVDSHENFELDRWDYQSDAPTARESAYRIKARAEEKNGAMFFSHDPHQAAQLRWAPEVYR